MAGAIRRLTLCAFLFLPAGVAPAGGKGDDHLTLMDVFELEYASDPRIAPDGESVVYVRNFMDLMNDARRSNLWTIRFDGSEHRPITTGNENHSSPRFSPDGRRLLYVSSAGGSAQLYVRWLDTGQQAKLTQLTDGPSGLSWSPDGRWIAFSMRVPETPKPFAELPAKPKNAKWADPPIVIDSLLYRADGAGYLEKGYRHLFILPAEGGTPRQVTSGHFNHNSRPVWSPDSRSLIFSANRREGWEFDPLNSEIYEVAVADGSITTLTDRQGPDAGPVLSADGKQIAYVGFDDHEQGYEVRKLYMMNRDGSDVRVATESLDRSVYNLALPSGRLGVYFLFADQGETKLARVSTGGETQVLARHVGGTSLGRPYGGGSYTVSPTGRFAYTLSTSKHPADIAVGESGKATRRLTALNDDLFSFRKLGSVEDLWFPSSHDQRQIQGWIVKPPDFDPSKKYPLILEIHGGPFANYGNRFSAEFQLYAAAGYVVLYVNPRGSTSYGGEFGNLIHHNYPGEDYNDLMSGVDAVIARGYVDAERLFVTGGSGGGVLSSWIIGKTDRFKAAVVAKPVINWTSFALTADLYTFFHKYWFAGYPWEQAEEYWRRSPLSLVGNVSTPTMLLTGEADYRTPISESEQYYQALRLLKVESVMVRIPAASHGISARPSNLIAKVAHILKWFNTHGGNRSPAVDGPEATNAKP